MLAAWIETPAKGRNGGPVRAGMWSAVVIGSHPVQDSQRAWLEVTADDLPLGLLPAYWIENKAGNSFWHAPVPPQGVGTRLHYRAIIEREGGERGVSTYQDTIVRSNLPDRTDSSASSLLEAEGLVGNRHMTVRVDGRGSTYDIYFPTVGLHSYVRPREGDNPHSRSHFRAIIGGLAIGKRLEWFTERTAWDSFQQYQGATNLLTTKLSWRHGPIQVLQADFVAMGDCLPLNAGRERSPGQYLKRFFIKNEGTEPRSAIFGVYVQVEINGGVGDVGLSWHEIDEALLAINRGHGHSNRKLAHDATVEFALALDDRGDVECEPTGPNEAVLFRAIELPAGQTVTIDLLVSGAFTGWSGDRGTFEHWLRPALNWFRSTDLDHVEQETARQWDDFIEPIPEFYFPKPSYAVSLRRSALAAALHADAEWGAIAVGLRSRPERVLLAARGDLRRLHPRTPGAHRRRPRRVPVAQSGPPSSSAVPLLVPEVLDRRHPGMGDAGGGPVGDDSLGARTPLPPDGRPGAGDVGLADGRAGGQRLLRGSQRPSGAADARRPGADQLRGDRRSGLRCLPLLQRGGGRGAPRGRAVWPASWVSTSRRGDGRDCADRIWDHGILRELASNRPDGPGVVDPEAGRFWHARRVSKLRALWTDDPAHLVDRSDLLEIFMLGLAVPFGLLPASDPRLVRIAESILRLNSDAQGRSPPPGADDVRARAGRVVERSVRSVQPRDLLDGPLPDPARTRDRAGPALDTGAGHVRRGPRPALPPRAGRPSVAAAGETANRAVYHGGTAWRLHSMLIETILDLAGLDYDAVDRRLRLRPVLPGSWPQTGIKQAFACGSVAYLLQRPIGGRVHHLELKMHLDHPVELDVALTCPDLKELGPWQVSSPMPDPSFDPRTGQIAWSMTLPAGHGEWSWTWG